MDDINIWETIIPNWLSAIGTVLAVIVALFQKCIRDWYNRPVIEIECNQRNNACIDKIQIETESSDVNKEIRIRVRLENKGNYTADFASLNIDSYFVKREVDGNYTSNYFTPKILKDHRGSIPKVIAPHLIYYFDVATVQKSDILISSGTKAHAKQFYKLFLLGDGKSIELGKGAFILPLKFYSSRTKTVVYYLKICWNSDEYTTEKKYFDVEILSSKEFNKLKIK